MQIDKFYSEKIFKNLNIVTLNHQKNVADIDFEQFDVAIIAIDFQEQLLAHSKIRNQLYNYYLPNTLKIIDLGDIYLDKNNFEAIKVKISELQKFIFQNNLPLILLSNSDEINSLVVEYFKINNLKLKYLSIVNSFELNEREDNYFNFLFENDNVVEKIKILGYQNFMVSSDHLLKFENKGNCAYRLSEIQNDPINFEPEFRDSDIVNFDISTVKFSDAPETKNSQPNGFSAYEICKLAYLAGLGDNLRVFRIYGFDSSININDITAKLAAQIIWHLLSSLENKKKINVLNETYENFFVPIDQNTDKSIKFVHCKTTDRWWFLCTAANVEKYFPCSFKDFSEAKEGMFSKRIEKYLMYNK